MNRRALHRLIAFGLLIIGTALVLRALYIPAKAALAQTLLERAFARTKPGEAAPKPWPWADIAPIAEIEVPHLHRKAIVLEGASGAAMAFGPGHMPNTPAIGAPGTAIIAAHRDTQFDFLGALKPGDVIAARTPGGGRLLFRVTEARIVRADASGLDPADGGPMGVRLALVTCYPFTGVFHSKLRYVVLADRTGGTKIPQNGGSAMSLYELLDLLASNYQKIDTLWQFFIWIHLALLGGLFVVPRRISMPERAVGFLVYGAFLYVNRSAMIDSYAYQTVLLQEIARFKTESDAAGSLIIKQITEFQLAAKIWYLPWLHLGAGAFILLALFFADALARKPDPE